MRYGIAWPLGVPVSVLRYLVDSHTRAVRLSYGQRGGS